MDLIDRMIRRLQHIEPTVNERRAKALENALRQEFGGEVTRTRKRRKKDDVIELISSRSASISVSEIARQAGCHRSSVYRVLGSYLQSKRTGE
jgi:DNA invertase Pin-like site-specific DNA recombinase